MLGHLVDHIERRIRLQDLRILMAVTKVGSMNKAAALLNSSQPAISRSITELETALGVRLLDRHRYGVEPTEYGRTLLECGVAVFDDLRQGLRNIEHLTDPAAGELRIGCSSNSAAGFVSAVIDRLSQRYPRITFQLVTGWTETLYGDLRGRSIDLLVARRFGPIADDRISFEFLFDNSLVVAAGAQSPWVRRRKIDLAKLAGQSWILPPATASGSMAMDAFRSSGLDYPRVTLVTNSLEVRMSLLATGRFLTMVPESVLRFPTKRPEIRVLPVKLPIAHVPIGIVTIKNRMPSPVARLFIEHARDIARPLAKTKV